MSVTPSNMLPLGTVAPNFSLPDTTSGKTLSLESIQAEAGTVVMFICNHCPYVVHIIDKLSDVARRYQARGIAFVAISANDIENYPQDAPDKMKQFSEKNKFTFPYLYDEMQTTAKAYQAACTPDFYVFDQALRCVYRGRFDEASPGNSKPVTGKDLTNALDRLLSGDPIDEDQRPSMGCNIKWKQAVS